jgi:DNA-binding response OmpR family regulator
VEGQPGVEAQDARPEMPRRILIVEDEAPLRRVVALNLVAHGNSVDEAGTAVEAMTRLLAERYDLMLLDICLPDHTGWDVLTELRWLGIEVPTIIASAMRISPNRLNEFQALGYLPKPFPLDALLRLVDGAHAPGVLRVNGEQSDAQGSPRQVGSEARG